jgi:transcriptional regulator with XRE-family HTH domain
MPSAAQIRAARALLGWSREDLASATGLTSEGLNKIERGISTPQRASAERIMRAFIGKGIVFTDDDGVKRQSASVQVYKGREGFALWFDDVYETVKDGGDIAISGCRETDFSEWISQEDDQAHTARMALIGDKLTCRAILREGDRDFTYSSYVTYRWASPERWDRNPLYLYGMKLAIIEFQEEGPTVTVVNTPAAARAFRKIFNTSWESCRDIPTLRKASS